MVTKEKLFVSVPHSPLLRAIVPTTGYASVYQLCLPVSARTLRSMLELLYTGEITATKTEVEEIKTGLTLLGILSPSEPSQSPACPPPLPQHQPRAQEPQTSLAVGIINSSQVCFLTSPQVIIVIRQFPGQGCCLCCECVRTRVPAEAHRGAVWQI